MSDNKQNLAIKCNKCNKFPAVEFRAYSSDNSIMIKCTECGAIERFANE